MNHAATALCAILATLAATPAQNLRKSLTAHVYDAGERGELPYRLFAPTTPAPESPKSQKPAVRRLLPLVLFLHGAGERGTDNAAQLGHGVRDFVSPKNQAARPCYVIAPQCPRKIWWMDAKVFPLVMDLVKARCEDLPIDRNRIYITGLSMGGYATWHAIARHPEFFAAAIPICGGGTNSTADLLADTRLEKLPIWVFHGDADRSVPIDKSKEMIAAVAKSSNAPKFTIYEGVGHNSWSRTYANPKVHAWLFAQRRASAVRPLEDGDRIAFFGDSITQAGAGKNGYIRMIEASLGKREPKLDVQLIGAGISGHKVPDLQKRLVRDVLSKKPTIVFIYIGINDVWHWNRDRGTEKTDFDAGLRDLVTKIGKAGARVILCTPSVIGEKTDGTNKFDKMLTEYSTITRKIAEETGTQLLDLRKEFLDHLRTHNKDNLARGILTRDTVHLNRAGNRFVAERMLEALGIPSGTR